MTPEPLDSVDLDALQEMERSPGYALFAARIAATIDQKRAELERPGVSPDLLRGELKALRLALRIPGILKQEIQTKE